MTELQDTTTKKLAELKAYLEKKVTDHEEEIKTIRSFLETVDALLAEKSYRRVEIPRSVIESVAKGGGSQTGQVITTMSGVVLAEFSVKGSDLVIVPSPALRLDVNGPPLRAFLVGKVLEPMRISDEEAAKKQRLSPDKVLAHRVEDQDGILKRIEITNYGDERRLNEIKNAVRWALRKMYEKTIGTR